MRYFVRVAFAAPTDIADPTFLEALEAAGLLRIVAANPLAFDIISPCHVSAGASGHWAGMLSDRLDAMRDDWTITVDRDAPGEVN